MEKDIVEQIFSVINSELYGIEYYTKEELVKLCNEIRKKIPIPLIIIIPTKNNTNIILLNCIFFSILLPLFY